MAHVMVDACSMAHVMVEACSMAGRNPACGTFLGAASWPCCRVPILRSSTHGLLYLATGTLAVHWIGHAGHSALTGLTGKILLPITSQMMLGISPVCQVVHGNVSRVVDVFEHFRRSILDHAL